MLRYVRDGHGGESYGDTDTDSDTDSDTAVNGASRRHN
jgi:hypothetical protein